ncbi:MAG TPA: D-alanyl-D-alanine carboxypeptidase [Candidatus Eisenbergiella merdipullorum]|uniref:serine-type D-Ala-D-Ala carboxypeptidase n=1 Tax=Candidatus Eisenbergiella merdipullorum TaxID=2838553 RepID=A0A9D2KZV7_9FIRM|nr:D-alanyl-D-alanine carboxypeptidase [Candidatus Eisenbergiella merdipullorum]
MRFECSGSFGCFRCFLHTGKIFPAVLFGVVLFSAVFGGKLCGPEGMDPVFAQEEGHDPADELYALSAVLMDADNGRILLQKNGTQVLPMASTTKIMTCILALEVADPEEYVTVSSYAAGMPKVRLGTRAGQVFRLKDLLYSLMLESHNDSAVIIAEHIGKQSAGGNSRQKEEAGAGAGSEEESRDAVLRFTAMMNEKAEQIGCTDTFFVTPNGLDAILTLTDEAGNTVERQHSTTAADLARIMSYCVTDSPKKEEFLEITRTPSYSFTDYASEEDGTWKAGSSSYSCNNHNAFLSMMEGALTGKTGFTAKAGYCYVGALERDGKTFSIALLACGWPNNKSWKWHDARILYEYGLANFEKRDIFKKEELPAIPVLEGIRNEAGLVQEQAEITLLLGASDEVRTQVQLAESLEAPVEEGLTVGWQNYFVNDMLYASLPIRTSESVERRTYRYCLKELLKLVWL